MAQRTVYGEKSWKDSIKVEKNLKEKKDKKEKKQKKYDPLAYPFGGDEALLDREMEDLEN